MHPENDEQEVVYRAPRRSRTLNGTQVMFAVIIAIALMLAVNFSSRVTADRDLRRVSDAVKSDIATLKTEQSSLIARLDFVQSEAFIEQWARSEGRMVREGDILAVLFPSQDIAVAPEVQVTPEMVVQPVAPVLPAWQLWWALFFDVPPPGA